MGEVRSSSGKESGTVALSPLALVAVKEETGDSLPAMLPPRWPPNRQPRRLAGVLATDQSFCDAGKQANLVAMVHQLATQAAPLPWWPPLWGEH